MSQLELGTFSHEQLQEIIRRSHRKQSLEGQKDVLKAIAVTVKKASMNLENAISEDSKRAVELKSLDACFVLDCTGSMASKILAAKEKIVEIQSRIMSCLGVGGTLRLSVVGYRDYGDEQPFEILPFTGEVENVESFLSKLKATGGGDLCEDVIWSCRPCHAVGMESKNSNHVSCQRPPPTWCPVQ